MAYTTKNSWDNIEHKSWYIREDKTQKLRYDLIPRDQLAKLAWLYTRGAAIYGDRNWEQASWEEELALYKQSAFRHFMSWLDGEQDEDHWSAVVWNVFWYEFCKKKDDIKDGCLPPVNKDDYDWWPISLDYWETNGRMWDR